jgi:sugar/nucleoside kinase (ribokinase family)
MTRQQIAAATAEALTAAGPTLASQVATIGLDGFVDEICAVVDTRHDHLKYEPIKTIAELGQKIVRAAGQSSNYELVVKQMKLGGNGPIMANALACAGLSVNYLGAIGYPNVHPVFEEFGKVAKLYPTCDPGHTDAVEFTDGKLMLGKITPCYDVNWANLSGRLGLAKLTELMAASRLIGMVNWTMLPNMGEIWTHLKRDVFPKLPKASRIFFCDLADPEKRTREDLLAGIKQLSLFQGDVDVILGLNLSESIQVAEVLGIVVGSQPEEHIERLAREIRAKLGLHTVVVHPRRGAAAADADGSAQFAGPFVASPKISTGAGDHFNAGFCLGRVLNLPLEQALCVGVATSGYYVRSAVSPSAAQLADFIRHLPEPQ